MLLTLLLWAIKLNIILSLLKSFIVISFSLFSFCISHPIIFPLKCPVINDFSLILVIQVIMLSVIIE